jgi:hypothetical protein
MLAEERERVTNAEGAERSDFRQNMSTLYTFVARQKSTTDWEASMRSLESIRRGCCALYHVDVAVVT